MKSLRRTRSETAFRVAFTILVVAAIATLTWQCTRQPGAPPRLDWQEKPPAKP